VKLLLSPFRGNADQGAEWRSITALARAFPPDAAAGTRYAAEQIAHLDKEKPASA
jgi:pyridoxine 4-dehydrogenase